MEPNPKTEEEEIHDLVLLFANSKLPRGSDAFKAVLDQFIPEDDEHDETDRKEEEEEREKETDSSKESSDTDDNISPTLMDSLKPRVHWPDDQDVKPLASSPSAEQMHHARLFMKTVPKPILKHDEECLILASGDHR